MQPQGAVFGPVCACRMLDCALLPIAGSEPRYFPRLDLRHPPPAARRALSIRPAPQWRDWRVRCARDVPKVGLWGAQRNQPVARSRRIAGTERSSSQRERPGCLTAPAGWKPTTPFAYPLFAMPYSTGSSGRLRGW
jgi:hypothetical protein